MSAWCVSLNVKHVHLRPIALLATLPVTCTMETALLRVKMGLILTIAILYA